MAKKKFRIVPQYIKNVTKSAVYAAQDIVQDTMPSFMEFTQNNTDTAKAVVNDIRNFRSVIKRTSQAWNSSSYNAELKNMKKNFFEDLKTGEIYNKKRDQQAALKASGFDELFDMSDFNFDDLEEDAASNESDLSSGDVLTAKAQLSTTGAVKEQTYSTIGAMEQTAKSVSSSMMQSSDYIVKNQTAINNYQMLATSKMFGEINNVLTDIGNNVRGIYEYTQNITTYFNATTKMNEDMNNRMNELVALNKELTEMQRNMYADYNRKDDVNYESSNAFVNRGFNLADYAKQVKKNIKNVYDNSMIGSSMGMFGEGTNPLSALTGSPAKFLAKGAVNKMISSELKKSMKDFDSMFSNFFQSAFLKMSDNFKTKGEDNPIYEMAYKIFGLKLGEKQYTRVDEYKKGPVPFNGLADRSITEVIPTYLRKILAAITNQPEMIYNYKTGKFNNVTDIKKDYKSKEDSTYGGIDRYKSEIKQRLTKFEMYDDERKSLNKDIDNLFKEMVDKGMFLDVNKMTKESLNNRGVDFENESNFKLIKAALLSMKKSDLFKMNSDVINTIDSRKRSNNDLNKDLLLNGFTSLFNGFTPSDISKQSDKAARALNGTDKNSSRAGTGVGLRTLDDYNYTVFDYLRQIRDTLTTGLKVYNVATVNKRGKKGHKYNNSITDNNNQAERYKDDINELEKMANEAYQNELGNSNNHKTVSEMVANASEKHRKFVNSQYLRNISQSSINSMVADENLKEDDTRDTSTAEARMNNYINDQRTKFSQAVNRMRGLGRTVTSVPQSFMAATLNRVSDAMTKMIYGEDGDTGHLSLMERITLSMDDFSTKFEDWFENKVKSPLDKALNGENGLLPTMKALFQPYKEKFTKQRDTLFGKLSNYLFGDNTSEMSPKDFYNRNVSPNLKSIGISAGIGAMASMFTPLGLIGGTLLGGGVGFLGSTDKAKNYLFGEVGDDGQRHGGKISESTMNKINTGLGKAKIGVGVGALASLFTPLGLVGGMLLGGVGGFASSMEGVKKFFFGELQSDGSRDDSNAIFKQEFVKKFKDMKPDLIKGTGLGVIGSFFLPGGPVGGALLGLSASIMLQKDNVKKYLFGDVNPETNKREGGLFGKIGMWFKVELLNPLKIFAKKAKNEAWHFIKVNMINPFLDSLEPLKKQIGIFKDMVKDQMKAGWGKIKDFVGGMFEKHVGKPFGAVIKENLTDPLKNMLKKTFSWIGKGIGKIISFPFQSLNKKANKYREQQKEAGVADYAEQEEKDIKKRHDDEEDRYKKEKANVTNMENTNNKARSVLEQNDYNVESIKKADSILTETSNIGKDTKEMTGILGEMWKTAKDMAKDIGSVLSDKAKNIKHDMKWNGTVNTRTANARKRSDLKNAKNNYGTIIMSENAEMTKNMVSGSPEAVTMSAQQSINNNTSVISSSVNKANDILESIKNSISRLSDKIMNIVNPHTSAQSIPNMNLNPLDKMDMTNIGVGRYNMNSSNTTSNSTRPNSVFTNGGVKISSVFDELNKNSHADGLDDVPEDGYHATLHEGEMVVPASVSERLKNFFGFGKNNKKDKKEKKNSFVTNLDTLLTSTKTDSANILDIRNTVKEIYRVVSGNEDDDTNGRKTKSKKKLINKIADNTDTISDSVDNQLNGVGYHVELISNLLVQYLGEPKNMPSGQKSGFKHKIKGAFDKLKGFLKKPLDFIMAPFKFIGNAINNHIIQPMKNFVGKIKEGAKKVGSFIIESGKKMFSFLGKATLATIEGIGKIGSAAIKGVFGLANTIAKTIGGVIVNVAKAIPSVIGAISTGIKKGFEVIGTLAKDAASVIGTVVKTAASAVSTLTKGLVELGAIIIPKLLSGLKSILGFVGKTAKKIFDFINPFSKKKRDKKYASTHIKSVDEVKLIQQINVVKKIEKVSVLEKIGDKKLFTKLDSIIKATGGSTSDTHSGTDEHGRTSQEVNKDRNESTALTTKNSSTSDAPGDNKPGSAEGLSAKLKNKVTDIKSNIQVKAFKAKEALETKAKETASFIKTQKEAFKAQISTGKVMTAISKKKGVLGILGTILTFLAPKLISGISEAGGLLKYIGKGAWSMLKTVAPKIGNWLLKRVKGAWTWFKPIVSNIWTKTIQPAVTSFWVNTMKPFFVSMWANYLSPFFNAILTKLGLNTLFKIGSTVAQTAATTGTTAALTGSTVAGTTAALTGGTAAAGTTGTLALTGATTAGTTAASTAAGTAGATIIEGVPYTVGGATTVGGASALGSAATAAAPIALIAAGIAGKIKSGYDVLKKNGWSNDEMIERTTGKDAEDITTGDRANNMFRNLGDSLTANQFDKTKMRMLAGKDDDEDITLGDRAVNGWGKFANMMTLGFVDSDKATKKLYNWGVNDRVDEAKDNISNGLSSAGNWIKDKYNAGVEWSDNNRASLGNWASEKWNSAKDGLGDIGDKILNAKKEADNMIDRGVDLVDAKISSSLGLKDEDGNPINLRTMASNKFNSFKEWAGNGVKSIADGASYYIGEANDWFKNKIEWFKTAIPDALNGIDKWIGGKIGLEDEDGNTLGLVEMAKKTFTWDNIKSFFGGIKTKYIDPVRDWFGNKIEWFKTTIPNALNGIDKWIGGKIGLEDSDGNSLGLFEMAKKTFTWDNAKSFFGGIKTKYIDPTFDWIGGIFTKVKDALKKGIYIAASSIAAMFGFTINENYEVTSTPVDKIKDVGKKAADGFSWVKENIKDFFYNEDTKEYMQNEDNIKAAEENIGSGYGIKSNKRNNIGAGSMNGATYYSQNDTNWKNKSYGSNTISETGCAPTAMAMLASSVNGTNVDPVQASNWAASNGYNIPNNGTSRAFVKDFGAANGIHMSDANTTGDIESALANNKPVILSGSGSAPFTNNGHVVMATGLDPNDPNKVMINDPISKGRSSSYNISSVMSKLKTGWISDKSTLGSGIGMGSSEALSKAQETIAQTAKDSAQSYKDSNSEASEMWDTVKDKFKELKGNVEDFASNANDKLGQTFGMTDEDGKSTSFTSGAKAGLSKAWNSVKSTVSGAWNSVKNGASSVWNWITGGKGYGPSIGNGFGLSDSIGGFGLNDPHSGSLDINGASTRTNSNNSSSAPSINAPSIWENYQNSKNGTITTNPTGSTNVSASTVEKTALEKLQDLINAGTENSPEIYNNAAYYRQGDDRWKTHAYGNSTVGKGGCGPTSTAMLLSTLTGRVISPMEMADWSASHGYKVSEGTSWGFFPAVGQEYGVPLTQTEDFDALKAALDEGYPAVLSGQGSLPFTSGGHLIFGVGTDPNNSSNVIINDPVNKDRSKSYSFDSLKNSGLMAGFVSGVKSGGAALGGSSSTDGTSSEEDTDNTNPFLKALADLGSLTTGYVTSALTGVAFDPDSILGTKTAEAATTTGTSSQTDAAANGNSTARAGQTVDIPDGLGTARTYMGWQCITAPDSTQYKLRQQAGQNFDSDGYGKINGRYTVATTTTYGDVGDYIDVKQSDGSVVKAIIADTKNQSDPGCNKWGHMNGQCVLEYVVDKNSWYSTSNGGQASAMHSNPGTANNHPEWSNLAVNSITNQGSYFSAGSGYGPIVNNPSIGNGFGDKKYKPMSNKRKNFLNGPSAGGSGSGSDTSTKPKITNRQIASSLKDFNLTNSTNVNNKINDAIVANKMSGSSTSELSGLNINKIISLLEEISDNTKETASYASAINDKDFTINVQETINKRNNNIDDNTNKDTNNNSNNKLDNLADISNSGASGAISNAYQKAIMIAQGVLQ